jgi:hypothetical protein
MGEGAEVTGQAAGLIVCAVGGTVAAVETFRGWLDRRRDEARHDAHIRARDGL